MSQNLKTSFCPLRVLLLHEEEHYSEAVNRRRHMDQIRIGSFIKELRKDKGLTQEQMAEHFNVSRRSVSRWETGTNLPDLDILMEMSGFFDLDLRELLDGERKSEKMNRESEETVWKVAEYSNEQKQRTAKTVINYFMIGIAGLILNTVMRFMDISDSFFAGVLEGITIGLPLGAMIFGLIYVSGNMEKMRAFKLRMLGRKDI